MKISKIVLFCFSAMFLALVTFPVKAGYNDPWWLLYKVKDGQMIYKKGPFSNEYECTSAKWSLAYGHEFIDCVQ